MAKCKIDVVDFSVSSPSKKEENNQIN